MNDDVDFKKQVDEYNRGQLASFMKQPVSERILFVAHCIKRQKRDEVKEFAENLGYRVFVVGGGSIVKKKILAEKPSAVVGIACFDEIKQATEQLKIPFQVVLLDTDGCEDTDFDLETAKAVLSACEL